MNRLDKLFQNKKENILTIYCTAGFPKLDDTLKVVKCLEEAGTDLVEIGMPFSDPIADGPTIQSSSTKALENGMTVQVLFEQLKDLRSEVSLPIVLMGYLNPVIQFGLENFCRACADCGIDGLILPDLPYNEYEVSYKNIFQKYGLYVIFLVTPQTSSERVQEIAQQSSGFLYMVSSASITGAKQGISQVQKSYFERINALNLAIPRLIGFGVSDNESFKTVCKYASGAIIGSAFIKAIASSSSLKKDIETFVKNIKDNI